MVELNDLLQAFALQRTGEHSWRGGNVDFGAGSTVFGGQLLGQSMAAAAAVDLDKRVKSIHTIFARAAATAAMLDLGVEVLQAGRTFASASVTVSQSARICARSLVLLHAPDANFISHQTPLPEDLSLPADSVASDFETGLWELRTVGGVDVRDPAAVGPPELDVWVRYAGEVPDDDLIRRALLAFATDGFLIGTAMRPHAGVGQALAHKSIATSVLTHTLTFHGPIEAGEWMLLRHESPFAGEGRSYGRALVYDLHGQMVASFVQENLIRG